MVVRTVLAVCFSSLCNVGSRSALIRKDHSELMADSSCQTCVHVLRSRGLRRKGHRGCVRVMCGSGLLFGVHGGMVGRRLVVGLAVDRSVKGAWVRRQYRRDSVRETSRSALCLVFLPALDRIPKVELVHPSCPSHSFHRRRPNRLLLTS